MHGVHEVRPDVGGNPRLPEHAAIAARRRDDLHATADLGLLVDLEVARGLVRRSGDVDDPRGIERAVADGRGQVLALAERRRIRNAPPEPGRLRRRGARAEEPLVSGASASSSRSHTARSNKSSVPACGNRFNTPSKPAIVSSSAAWLLCRSTSASFLTSASRPISMAGIACEPPFGVPSMMNRAPGCWHMRCHVFSPGVAREHRPHDETAHGMGEESNRLVGLLGDRQHLVDRGLQLARGTRRAAGASRRGTARPCGSAPGPCTSASYPLASSPVALDPILLCREQRQAAARELQEVHPHRPVANGQLRSHDPRQHEHDGLRERCALDVVRRRDRRRSRLERPELAVGASQRRDELSRRVRPREVVEVRDLIAGVDPIPDAAWCVRSLRASPACSRPDRDRRGSRNQ